MNARKVNNIYPPAKNERNSSLELLRIFATIFVVIIHFNNNSAAGGKAFIYTEALPIHYHILLICEMMCICAVNIFVMISGYFLCTSTYVRISKVLRLYIDVIFFSTLCYVLSCALKDCVFDPADFLRHFIPLNWYVAVYSALYLISPFLNQILQNKSRSEFGFMLLVFFFVLSIWPSGIEFLSKALHFSPNSLNPISNQGSGDGYTLVNFILMYFLGSYCRLHGNVISSIKKRVWACAIYFFCTVLNTLYAHFFFGRATSYCNPFVVIQAVAIFVVFQNTKIKSPAVNSIAGCSFGVYLMHSFFFRFCMIEQYVTGNPLMIPIYTIITAILIYAICAIIYWCYLRAFRPIFALIQHKLDFLTYDINGLVNRSQIHS